MSSATKSDSSAGGAAQRSCVSCVSTADLLLSLPLASGFVAVASPANSPATLPATVGLRPSPVCSDQTAASGPTAPGCDTHFRRPLGRVAASRGVGARQVVIDTLTVMMQDLLTQNHALRRENDELMDRVRRLLCEKANLLAQVWPRACPVAFPETFKGMQPLAGT